MKRKLMLAVVLMGSALSACASHRSFAGYGPPPPPRYGVVGVAPGPRYVWTDGFWDRRGRDWYWVSGRWAVPPRSRAVWVPGHWVRHGRGYEFRRGHWR